MRALSIGTGGDLLQWSLADLEQHFGKAGRRYYNLARAVDERPVVSERIRKSLGSETTFSDDLADRAEIMGWLERLAGEVLEALDARGIRAHTLTVKVKYSDFSLITRSHTRTSPYRELDDARPVLAGLLDRTQAGNRPIRLLGVTVSGLAQAEGVPRQFALF